MNGAIHPGIGLLGLLFLASTVSCIGGPNSGLGRGQAGEDDTALGRVTIGSIEWETDYDRALTRAKQTGKPLWLHFGENPG